MVAVLGRVLGLWGARGGWLIAGAAISIVSVLLGLALMALAGRGVAEGIHEGMLFAGGGGLAFLLLRGVVVARPVARYLERLVTHEATFRALADTRVWFFGRLAERLPAGIGMRRMGDLLGRLVSDVEALDGFYLRALVPGAAAIAAVLGISLVLGFASPGLAAMVVVPLALALALPPLLAPRVMRTASAVASRRGALRAAVVDPLTGMEDTLAANAEARAAARVAVEGAALAEAERRVAREASIGGAAGAVLNRFALLGALGWGLAVGAEGMGPAVLGVFLAVASAEALGLMPRAGASIAAASAAGARLFEAADTAPPVPEPSATPALPIGNALRVEGVRFAWSADRAPVFDALDLDVPEGARVALLGPSGTGKSTLAALLLKLAAPSAGRITLGGVDIALLPAALVRTRIACLTQDARLFDDTIAANLRLAAPDADDAALWQALDRARIGEVVRALPDGLATQCGEAGVRFSGGQARRLVLARVLLSPAAVLILDEPAAGLDAANERAFLETLESATAGRSVILITHRLMGVERPTRILRLVGGRAIPAAG